MSISLVLPRPWTPKPKEHRKIPAPSEASFVAAFGQILPKAQYLHSPQGTAAYYELPPSCLAAENLTRPVSHVLFIHGVQTSAIGLQPLASVLSSRFPHAQCVLVDLWGHGLSDTPVVAHEQALFHGLIKDLLVKLGWNDAHFLGYSFGGSITASFAALSPEAVSSMVLVAPAGLWSSAQFGEAEKSYLKGGEGLEDQARAWVVGLLEGGELVVPVDWKERVSRGEVVAEAVRDVSVDSRFLPFISRTLHAKMSRIAGLTKRKWQTKQHEGHTASVVGIFRDGGVLDRQAEFAQAAKQNIETLCVLGELDDVCSLQDLQKVGMHNVVVVPQVGHAIVRQRVLEVAQQIEEFWSKLQEAK
ncbi:hypothetical protein PZA11_003814 [Diplocarpon coronariae]|uniref:AB hydrolase-1 domain-containing protein n=1 Tax=Diplocarpon coronariae TaxID=2795749 RepID=A0A218Z6E5_9HELO|nr:hypothetical protein JHW43_006229 [Diplocarpon mali]OWP03627.1 hypothetical protein B2J93_3248 [Marssonina coronariae]